MYKSDQERIVTEVLAAHIALRSSPQFSKIIILKSPPLQKDLFAVLLSYLYRNTLSLQVNQLHCHLHKHRTQAIPSGPYAWALAYSSRHGLQIPRCISILFNNITQYYCFLNNSYPKKHCVSILKSLLDAQSPTSELLSLRQSNWLEGRWLQLICCTLPKHLCP